MQLNTNNNNTNTPSKKSFCTWHMDFDERILSTTTTSISTFSIYQFPILSKIPSSNNKNCISILIFVHVLIRSRNNYHLTFTWKQKKLVKISFFLEFLMNKKNHSHFIHQPKYLKNIINQKYFLCQRFLFLQIFQISIKKYF